MYRKPSLSEASDDLKARKRYFISRLAKANDVELSNPVIDKLVEEFYPRFVRLVRERVFNLSEVQIKILCNVWSERVSSMSVKELEEYLAKSEDYIEDVVNSFRELLFSLYRLPEVLAFLGVPEKIVVSEAIYPIKPMFSRVFNEFEANMKPEASVSVVVSPEVAKHFNVSIDTTNNGCLVISIN